MPTTQAPRPPAPGEFVAYEYATVKADRDLESLYRDAYRNFGWEIDGYGPRPPGSTTVTLRFKRDRRIRNRSAVTELQRTCERALGAISRMERSKESTALVAALCVGIVGCAFLAGAVFAIEAGMWLLSVPLGAVGLLLWLAGYVSHGRVRARRTERLDPQIDREYEVVYDTGEQAARLIA